MTSVDRVGRDQLPDDTVAIVGMQCRFPQADSTDEFWQMLDGGRDAVRPIPEHRLAASFYDERPGTPGRTNVRAASLLDDLDGFDHNFFRIVRREAQFIDPMHRMLLETSWHALESACVRPESVRGSRTGVYVGAYAADYTTLHTWAGRPDLLDAHSGPNSLHSMASGRLSHAFDLAGPAMTVDTACSSSLVAIHLAVQALRAGECDLALAGGVSIALAPDPWINLSLAQMISPDGRCKTFDTSADGYGRGEGCGVLVLQRLGDARAAGRPILAVVRGSSVKHDGRSTSVLAPSRRSQVAVIGEALARAGVRPQDVGYVEAHGTGTPTGDPVELAALVEAFDTGDVELPIGSVKTNIGHLEGASGVAGVIKAVLALGHERIPAHLNVVEPTAAVDLGGTRLRVAVDGARWPAGRVRVAGVNSFGLSGTNAHLILQEPPPASPTVRTSQGGALLLTVNAATATARSELARSYAAQLDAGTAPADLARTANTARARLSHRAVVVPDAAAAGTVAELLRAVAEGRSVPGALSGRVAGNRDVPVAFLYPGQGSQVAGGGRELAQESPLFAQALARAVHAVESAAPEHRESLLDLLLSDGTEGELARTENTQPALFAVQYALTVQLAALGVRPQVVLGHSVGAFAAAVAAGALPLEKAARLVAQRGRLLERGTTPGAMAAVLAGRDLVEQFLEGLHDRVAVAAVNGPEATTISGEPVAVAEVCRRLAARDLVVRPLTVTRGFHSPLMDPVLDAFRRQAAVELGDLSVVSRPVAQATFISDLLGAEPAAHELVDPAYWVRHLREPVDFARGVDTAVGLGTRIFVEVGVGHTLVRLARAIAPQGSTTVTTLTSGSESLADILTSVGQVHVHGGAVDLDRLHTAPGVAQGRLVDAPRYPFEHERGLVAPPVAEGERFLRHLAATGERHEVEPAPTRAGSTVVTRDGMRVHVNHLDPGHPGQLAGHRLFGQLVVPGAHWMSAVATTALRAAGTGTRVLLERVEFRDPLVLGEQPMDVVVELLPHGARTWSFAAAHREATVEPVTVDHALGVVRVPDPAGEAVSMGSSGPQPAVSSHPVQGSSFDGAGFYAQLAARGLDLQGAYRAVVGIRRERPGHARARLRVPDGMAVQDRASKDDAAPPAGLLDALFQSVAVALPDDVTRELDARGLLLIPSAVDSAVLVAGAAAGECSVRAHLVGEGRRIEVHADIELRGDDGELLVALHGVRLAAVSAALVGPGLAPPPLVLRWRPLPEDEERAVLKLPTSWTVVAHPGARSSADVLTRALSATAPVTTTCEPPRSLPPGAAVVVVHCGEAPPGGRPLSAAVTDAALLFLQAVRSAAAAGGRVYLLTTGGAGACGPADPVAAALSALARTSAHEQPDVFGGIVDAGGELDEASCADAVSRWTGGAVRADRIAYRDGVAHVPRLEQVLGQRAGRTPTDSAVLRGTVLITGGLGAVGGHLARHLLAGQADRVVLVGRRPPGPDVDVLVRDLDPTGERVEYRMLDTTDQPAVSALVTQLLAGGELGGIIHAAGVLDDALLAELDADRLRAVLAAKADGAAHLHRALPSDSPVPLVFCSSIAGTFGTPVQGGYAAANAVLDALAVQRRDAGGTALSVAFGPWAGEGMVSSAGSAHLLQRMGIPPLAPLRACAAFTAALSLDEPFAVVAEADWGTWRASLGSGLAGDLLRSLVRAPAADSATDGASTTAPADLTGLSPARRRDVVLDLVLDVLAETLGMAVDRIDRDSSLIELGVDSLLGLELRNRFESVTGVVVPVSMVLAGATVEQIVAHLADDGASPSAGGTVPAMPGTRPPSNAELLAKVDEMSDEDVSRLLAELEAEAGGIS